MMAMPTVPAPARIGALADGILRAVRDGRAGSAPAQAMIGAEIGFPCRAIAMADAERSLPRLPDGTDGEARVRLRLPASALAGDDILILGEDRHGRRVAAAILPGADDGALDWQDGAEADVRLLAVPAHRLRILPLDPRLPDLVELLYGYAQLGLLLAMYDRGLDYVAGRRGRNGALGDRSGVRRDVAELFLALLSLRAILDRCIDHVADRDGFAAAVALARIHWFDAAPDCAIRCMDLHGGVATISGQPMRTLHAAFLAGNQVSRRRAAWLADAERA